MWWLPNNADQLYTLLTRTGPDGTQTITVSGASYTDRQTVIGDTYSYTLTAVDAAGNVSYASEPRQATALAPPHLVVPAVTSSVSSTLAFPLTWGAAANPPHTTYDVQGISSNPSYSGQATTATGTKFTSVAGHTYAFQAATADNYGNGSVPTPWMYATVPFDQTAGTFSHGWKTVKASGLWLGSEAATTTNRATVTFTVRSKTMQVIGDKLPSGASFRVYVGGVYKGTVSTRSTVTRHRQILWSHAFSTSARRTLKLVAVVTSGRTLRIDGLAAAP